MGWHDLKDEAARLLLEKDALHIYAALLIQVTAAKLTRRSLGHLFPWCAVLGLECVNEVIDILRGQEPELRAWQVVSGVHDLVNTMILPTILLLLCRRAPELLTWPGGQRPAGIGKDEDDRPAGARYEAVPCVRD